MSYKNGTTHKEQQVLPQCFYGPWPMYAYIDTRGIENEGKETIIIHPEPPPSYVRGSMDVDNIPFDEESNLAFQLVKNKTKRVYHIDRETLEVIAILPLVN